MKCPFPIPFCLMAIGVIAIGVLLLGGKKKNAA